jgi:hypothetical protein
MHFILRHVSSLHLHAVLLHLLDMQLLLAEQRSAKPLCSWGMQASLPFCLPQAFDRVSGSTVALKLYHMNKLNSISSHQVAREVRFLCV